MKLILSASTNVCIEARSPEYGYEGIMRSETSQKYSPIRQAQILSQHDESNNGSVL